MGTKRIILYVLLFGIMMSLWSAWVKEHPPAAVKDNPQQNSTQNPPVGPAIDSSGNVVPDSKHLQAAAINNNTGSVLATVDTNILHLVFNKQGNIMQSALLDYMKTIKGQDPILLIDNKAHSYYQMQTGFVAAPGSVAIPKNITFTTAKTNYKLADNQTGMDVVFTAKLANGFTIQKDYRISRSRYALQMRYIIKNNSGKQWQGSFYGQIQRVPQIISKHAGALGFHSYQGTAFSSVDKPYNKISYKDLDESGFKQITRGGWLAMQQHYFLTAFVPKNHEKNHYYGNSQSWEGTTLYTIGYSAPMLQLSSGQQANGSTTFYVGPEIAKQLDQVAPHLSLTIDYGWFWWIASPIFKILSWVHSWAGNWGVSIIIVTLLIQLLFYKLNEKSFISMSKMRDVAPRMKELQKRYADDKPALQRAVMEMYKEEKINPLGGCFPILIQIPVFIALYWVLGESVVLRHAPFFGWIHDLSVRDPYFILPVLMGITMFLQQRMAPQPPDSTQAKMMMLMPVVMTALFLFFPAGLVLYWLTRNVASIVQQRVINRVIEREKQQRRKKR